MKSKIFSFGLFLWLILLCSFSYAKDIYVNIENRTSEYVYVSIYYPTSGMPSEYGISNGRKSSNLVPKGTTIVIKSAVRGVIARKTFYDSQTWRVGSGSMKQSTMSTLEFITQPHMFAFLLVLAALLYSSIF